VPSGAGPRAAPGARTDDAPDRRHPPLAEEPIEAEVIAVESALQFFLSSFPLAAVIWSLLLLVAGGLAVALVTPRDHHPSPSADSDDVRFAAEVTVAADRAAVTAQRWRAEWEQAQAAVDAAWAGYEEADRAVRRIAGAAAFGTPFGWALSCDGAERERYLHRAATAACRRHEISIRQLNEALAHRGWDPRLHPVEQEAALVRAARTNRLTAWQQARQRERQAWEAAEAAAEALRALRVEAVAARLAVGLDLRPAGEQWWIEPAAATQPLPVIPRQSTVDRRHPVAA
jgi:hypothetical protein